MRTALTRTVLIGVAVALGLIATTAPPAAWAGPPHHGKPTIAISTAPDTLDAPAQCMARVVVTMTNTSSAAGFVTIDVDASSPLQVSRSQLITYFVAHYSWSTPIVVTVPAGTAPGTYALTVTAGRTHHSVPLTVAGGGAHCLAPEQLSATATSYHPDVPPSNAVDGDLLTRWGVEYSPYKDGPQSITIDTGSVHVIDTLRYWPRQDNNNSGIITAYNLYVSTDGTTFDQIGSGTWAFDQTMKTAQVGTDARYVRLEVTEGGRDGAPTTGGYGVAAEIQLVTTTS